MNKRVVNCRFKVCGLRFDAAIDCDWDMHYYEEVQPDVTPIELYCFDRPEWGIRMIFHKEHNEQQRQSAPRGYDVTFRTCADLDEIKREAEKWVKEMTQTP